MADTDDLVGANTAQNQQKTTVTQTRSTETSGYGDQEEPETLLIVKFGGRKFIMVMVLSFMLAGLLIGQWIDQNIFGYLVAGLAAGYLGINIYQKFNGK